MPVHYLASPDRPPGVWDNDDLREIVATVASPGFAKLVNYLAAMREDAVGMVCSMKPTEREADFARGRMAALDDFGAQLAVVDRVYKELISKPPQETGDEDDPR